jgi:hypothetical protein
MLDLLVFACKEFDLALYLTASLVRWPPRLLQPQTA